MVDGVIEFGDGVTVSAATEADFAEANARMRPLDHEEVAVFGDAEERFDLWEIAYAVRINGDLVGILGCVPFDGLGPEWFTRLITFLTTESVHDHEYVFVRRSRDVAEWMFREALPKHVTTVCAITIAKYERSLEWEKRILGFKEDGRGELNGVEHVFMSRPKIKGGA